MFHCTHVLFINGFSEMACSLFQDPKVKVLFQRIATLRQQWKDHGLWGDGPSPSGNDDDSFEPAETLPKASDGTKRPDEKQASSPAIVPGSAEKAVQHQLDMLNVPHASFSEDQRHLLFSLLSEIERAENAK